MRRCAIERRDGDPAGRVRTRVEAYWNDTERDRKLITGLRQRQVVEPQHAAFVLRNLGAIVIVGCEVSMCYGTRMVVIRFVDMLRRGDG